jgi:hypothetical protein
MLRVLCMMLVTLLIVINSGSDALAEKRVALVIGNSGYKAVTALQNPANDSADIARALEALDFEVELVSDLTFDNMRRSLRSFSKRASGADVALVFYAGHGIEVDGQNYLIPVDARLESSDDVDYEALPLNLVMGSLNGAKKLKLVLLDACRNNPFIAGMKTSGAKRAIGRGLARVEPSVGTLVGFAAKEGTTASDGDGRNSPYTKALLEHLDEPGLEINLLFRKVRDSVLSQTNGQQEPFTYGSLPGRQLYLKDGSQSAKPVATGAIPSSIKLSEAGQVSALRYPYPAGPAPKQSSSTIAAKPSLTKATRLPNASPSTPASPGAWKRESALPTRSKSLAVHAGCSTRQVSIFLMQASTAV